MCGIGTGLRSEVDDALLPDLRRRNLLEADVDAGQGFELWRDRNKVFEIARRDHRNRDGFAGSLLPVDLGRFVGRKIGLLRGSLPKYRGGETDQCCRCRTRPEETPPCWPK
jgi:hypothetical protein